MRRTPLALIRGRIRAIRLRREPSAEFDCSRVTFRNSRMGTMIAPSQLPVGRSGLTTRSKTSRAAVVVRDHGWRKQEAHGDGAMVGCASTPTTSRRRGPRAKDVGLGTHNEGSRSGPNVFAILARQCGRGGLSWFTNTLKAARNTPERASRSLYVPHSEAVMRRSLVALVPLALVIAACTSDRTTSPRSITPGTAENITLPACDFNVAKSDARLFFNAGNDAIYAVLQDMSKEPALSATRTSFGWDAIAQVAKARLTSRQVQPPSASVGAG